MKFAGASSAGVRYGSPAFISKLTAVVNSSQWFASVRHRSSALLSTLLSKCPVYLAPEIDGHVGGSNHSVLAHWFFGTSEHSCLRLGLEAWRRREPFAAECHDSLAVCLVCARVFHEVVERPGVVGNLLATFGPRDDA